MCFNIGFILARDVIVNGSQLKQRNCLWCVSKSSGTEWYCEGLDSSCVTSISLLVFAVRIFASALWFDLCGHGFSWASNCIFECVDRFSTGECSMNVLYYHPLKRMCEYEIKEYFHGKQRNTTNEKRPIVKTPWRRGLNWSKIRRLNPLTNKITFSKLIVWPSLTTLSLRSPLSSSVL